MNASKFSASDSKMPRVIVAGGSVAGLSAAIFLSEAGCDVDVYERSQRPLEGRGAGIVCHPTIFGVLGCDPTDITAQVMVLRYLDSQGDIFSEAACNYRFIAYATLHKVLMDRIDSAQYHLGSEVVSFLEAGEEVQVKLSDGTVMAADLLVCADGIHSSSRRQLLPGTEPKYAGYVGWRGILTADQMGSETYSMFADSVVYSVPPNSHALIYPILNVDTAAGAELLINWVWYRNVEEGPLLDQLLTDTSGARRPFSLAAGEVSAEKIAELVAAAQRTLPPQIAELVTNTKEPFVQVISDIDVPSMAFGRIALIGDAAFAVRPHIAVGTAKAIEDAWTLVNAVTESPDEIAEALRKWEVAQLALGHAAASRARLAGHRSQVENSWQLGEALPYGLYESGDSLLDWDSLKTQIGGKK